VILTALTDISIEGLFGDDLGHKHQTRISGPCAARIVPQRGESSSYWSGPAFFIACE